MANEPTHLLLQVREKLWIGSDRVACTCVDVHVVGGKYALHSFCLLLNEPMAIIGWEQVVLLVAVVDVEVLDARMQQLQLRTLALEVQPAKMLALDFALAPWTARCAALTVDEGQSLAIWIAHTLQSLRGCVVSEQAHSLDNCVRIVVGSFCRVV